MMAVFGPRAMNEKKFSQWETRLGFLGLEFDLATRTISMPQRKIDKACTRIESLSGRERATRSELLKLLGSLRHVCTCCRAAKPFFQRIQDLASAAPPYGSVALSDVVKQDLHWSHALLRLGKFRNLPTTMFGAWPDPGIHLYMDASNSGLAVLDPDTKRFLQLKFDDHELQLIAAPPAADGFTINMREHFSIALAAIIWGPFWAQRFSRSIGQVWCWVDNTTAVASVNKLASRNAMTQSVNRWIGFAEAVYGFRIRCIHLPGKINTMADAASRAWAPPHTDVWNTLSQGWIQDAIPAHARRLYEPLSSTFSSKDWLATPGASTHPCRTTGSSGVVDWVDRRGSQPRQHSTPSSSPCSSSTAGPHRPTDSATHPRPCCPRSAQSRGVIGSSMVTPSASTQDICWPCKGCAGCRHLQSVEHPPPPPSSTHSELGAILPSHTITFSGGLLSWASSSCSEAQSISRSTVQ